MEEKMTKSEAKKAYDAKMKLWAEGASRIDAELYPPLSEEEQEREMAKIMQRRAERIARQKQLK